jgi:uncharacterized protein YecE (DUF72 family)
MDKRQGVLHTWAGARRSVIRLDIWALREIASLRLAPRFRVGTAAWVNPPNERLSRLKELSHLAHYAMAFNFVEINSSFYRSHRRLTYERWRDQTPAGFGFSVKLPRSVTHECALRRYRQELRQFVEEVEGLGQKLRVVLVQLPASLPFEAGVATRFFKSLTDICPSRIACEPRHASWFTERADTNLRTHGVARVAADPARAVGGDSPGGSMRLVYYRLHGSPKVYYSAYSLDFVTRVAGQMKRLSSRTKEICCVFDNTARHESWPNAQQLCSLLR